MGCPRGELNIDPGWLPSSEMEPHWLPEAESVMLHGSSAGYGSVGAGDGSGPAAQQLLPRGLSLGDSMRRAGTPVTSPPTQ